MSGLNATDYNDSKPGNVEEYIASVPTAGRARFEELRNAVRKELPDAREVLSYGIIGYKVDDRRARVFISGWKIMWPFIRFQKGISALGAEAVHKR